MQRTCGLRNQPRRRATKRLDIEISFLEGLVQRAPGYVDALRLLTTDYARSGKFARAVRLNKRLTRLCPGDPIVHYNQACIYSLMAQHGLAVASLERAIDLGYQNFKWMASDPDLSSLRRRAEYKRILIKVIAAKLAVH